MARQSVKAFSQIRDAIPEEEHQIRVLLDLVIHESLDATVHDIPSIIENVNDNVDLWIADAHNIVHLVAEANGELVGVIMIKEFWNFCSLFVDPAHQRKGIGRQLVHAALERCKGRSPHGAVHLHANDEALGFYLALGFEVKNPSKPAPVGSTAMKMSLA